MKKQYTNLKQYTFIGMFLLLLAPLAIAQVGINTITPGDGSILDIESSEKGIFIPRISITDLTTITPITGITGAPAEAAAAGLLAYNTFAGTGIGFYFWNGTDWAPLSGAAAAEPPIDSVSLATDQTISSATFALVPGMTQTFTARKTSVLVNVSASGYGDPSEPHAWIEIRVLNGLTSIGGTQTNIHSSYRPTNPASNEINTSWSASYSKLLTGLTVGVSYTLTLQARVDGTDATNEAYIEPLTGDPDASHLTLTILQ